MNKPVTNLKCLNFCGLNLLTGSFESAADWLIWQAGHKEIRRPPMVVHINVYNYYVLQQNPQLIQPLKQRSYLFFDGIGLKLGAWLSGLGWQPDLNGTDLYPIVMEKAAKHRLRIFCLGGKKEVIGKAVLEMKKNYEGIEISGFHSGYFQSGEEEEIIASINEGKTDILMVGRRFPLQEEFTLKHQDKLNVALIWNVGGLFDFVSQTKPRAPFLLRKMRLEWLYRFLLEPGRMWHRNFVAAPWFIGRILRNRLFKGRGIKLQQESDLP